MYTYNSSICTFLRPIYTYFSFHCEKDQSVYLKFVLSFLDIEICGNVGHRGKITPSTVENKGEARRKLYSKGCDGDEKKV